MNRTTMFILAVGLIFCAAASYAQTLAPIVVPADCRRVIELVNQERERCGLPRLIEDKEMCRACETYSIIMSGYEGFKHSLNFRRFASCECIAGNVWTPEGVVNLWFRQCGRRAFLAPGRYIGVGACKGYWTLRVR